MWPDGSYYDVICSRYDYMSYDNNGNMTKKEHGGNMEPNENHTYTYDILNRLEKHTLQGGAVTTYHYGSDGLRDKKTTGGDTIKYYCDENGIVLNEANASGGHRATNVVGADGTIIARKNQNGDIGKFIKNEHGDVTNVIGETASNTYKYEPWGTITAKTGTFDNPIRYSGEYYDDESGLIYLRNRYYDPSLRRFISEDPAKDGLNWYVYCGNNPVNAVDPWGLHEETIQKMLNITSLKIQYINGDHSASVQTRASNARSYIMNQSPLRKYSVFNSVTTYYFSDTNRNTIASMIPLTDVAYYTGAAYYMKNEYISKNSSIASDMYNPSRYVQYGMVYHIFAFEQEYMRSDSYGRKLFNGVNMELKKENGEKGTEWALYLFNHVTGKNEEVARIRISEKNGIEVLRNDTLDYSPPTEHGIH